MMGELGLLGLAPDSRADEEGTIPVKKVSGKACGSIERRFPPARIEKVESGTRGDDDGRARTRSGKLGHDHDGRHTDAEDDGR
jgi:hypothetical protein